MPAWTLGLRGGPSRCAPQENGNASDVLRPHVVRRLRAYGSNQKQLSAIEENMSLFGKLLSKIFPSSHPAVKQGAAAQQAGGQVAAQQTAQGMQPSATTAQSPHHVPSSSTSQAGAAQSVDVEKILDDMAKQNTQKLNWRTSIVDLMKLVGMDSSLNARKELARELNYSGDTNDSAAMNVWLHKQVMAKIAANGGNVPQDLLH